MTISNLPEEIEEMFKYLRSNNYTYKDILLDVIDIEKLQILVDSKREKEKGAF